MKTLQLFTKVMHMICWMPLKSFMMPQSKKEGHQHNQNFCGTVPFWLHSQTSSCCTHERSVSPRRSFPKQHSKFCRRWWLIPKSYLRCRVKLQHKMAQGQKYHGIMFSQPLPQPRWNKIQIRTRWHPVSQPKCWVPSMFSMGYRHVREFIQATHIR